MKNLKMINTMIVTLILMIVISVSAQAQICEPENCQYEEAPEWLFYPDVTPVQLDVYRDAGSDNPRDIVVCLTIANTGFMPVSSTVEFDVYRSFNGGSEIFDQEADGPIGGRHFFPSNTITLDSFPRVPGSGNTPTSDPTSITYIVDYNDDIEEVRETNNEITVLYSALTAEARYNCEDDGSDNQEMSDEEPLDTNPHEEVLNDNKEIQVAKDAVDMQTATDSPDVYEHTTEDWSTRGATPGGIEAEKNEWWADGATPSAIEVKTSEWSTKGATPGGFEADEDYRIINEGNTIMLK